MEQKDSKKKTTKRFHRHFETPGVPIYRPSADQYI